MSDAGVGSLVAFHAIGKWCATHQSAPRRSGMRAPSARRASPSARRRSRRRTTGGGREAQPTPETSVASQPATGLGTPTVQPNQGEPGWVGISSAWPGVHGCGSPRAARIPIRTPAVAAMGHGRRGRGADSGRGMRVIATQTSPPEAIARRTCATGVQAARRHPGEERCALRRPTLANHGCWRPPHRAHPHPPAGGRGDGPRAAGAGNGRPGSGGAKRVMPTQPVQPEAIVRRNSATGVQAARRHPGEVA